MLTSHEITNLLIAWSDGDRESLDKLAPLVQSELHRLARAYLAKERPGHILQATALVHEAYLRLIDWQNVRWQNRAHFFGVAAQMMRRILVDYAVKQKSEKHGGGARPVSLGEAAAVFSVRNPDLIALDAALDKLAALNSRQSRVIELRFFGGL